MNNILTRDQWHDREQLINDIRGVFPIRIDASFENRTVFFSKFTLPSTNSEVKYSS